MWIISSTFVVTMYVRFSNSTSLAFVILDVERSSSSILFSIVACRADKLLLGISKPKLRRSFFPNISAIIPIGLAFHLLLTGCCCPYSIIRHHLFQTDLYALFLDLVATCEIVPHINLQPVFLRLYFLDLFLFHQMRFHV